MYTKKEAEAAEKKKKYVKPSEARYKCYSINLHKYLKEMGLKTIGEEKHAKTKRIAYIYKKTKDLDKYLKIWSDEKV